MVLQNDMVLNKTITACKEPLKNHICVCRVHNVIKRFRETGEISVRKGQAGNLY